MLVNLLADTGRMRDRMNAFEAMKKAQTRFETAALASVRHYGRISRSECVVEELEKSLTVFGREQFPEEVQFQGRLKVGINFDEYRLNKVKFNNI